VASWENKDWKKAGGENKNLKIIEDRHAIYRPGKKERNLTRVSDHVGTEDNDFAHRMATPGASRR